MTAVFYLLIWLLFWQFLPYTVSDFLFTAVLLLP